MNKFQIAAKIVTHKAVENGPAILTAMGAVGVVTTAVLAAQGASKATLMIEEVEHREGVADDPKQRLKERAQLVWTCYIPAATMGVATISCIISANSISNKRTAAVMSAYTLAEKGFKEYQEKVVEQFGETKDRKVREAVLQDRMESEPVSKREVIIAGSGEVLCFDTLTGRYFKSSMEELRKAENDVNYQIINNMYASQNEFYRALELSGVKGGEDVGWNNDKRLELNIMAVLSDDGRPCLALEYKHNPVIDYQKIW